MKFLGVFLKTVAAIFVFSILTACGGGGGGDGEQNSGITNINVNASGLQGNLSINQEKVFSFNVEAGVQYQVVLQSLNGDSDVAVFNAQPIDSTTLVDLSLADSLNLDIVSFTASKTGTYYIEIAGFLATNYLIQVVDMATPYNTIPIITSSVLIPQPAYTTTDLQNNYTVLDFDSDTSASYVWRVNNTETQSGTSNTLTSNNFVKNDTVNSDLSVSDGTYTATVTDTIIISDTLPVINPIANQQTNYATLVSQQLDAYDLDNDPITYSLLSGPTGMQVSNTGLMSWTPTAILFDKTGNDFTWTVSVDADGNSSELTGVVSVTDQNRSQPLARSGIDIPNGLRGLLISDLDNDSKNEILVADLEGRLYSLEYDGTNYNQDWMKPLLHWDNTITTSYDMKISAIDVSDLDGDGYPEIVYGLDNIIGTTQANYQITLLDGKTKSVISKVATSAYGVTDIAIRDIDNDGTMEVIALVKTDTNYNGNSKIMVLNASNLLLEWESAADVYGKYFAVGNLDADAYIEVVTNNGFVYSYNGATYTNKWATSTFGFKVDVGDIDGDGIDEVVGMNSSGVVDIYSVTTKSLSWKITPSGFTPGLSDIRVANIDVDNSDEIIVGEGQWGDVIAYSYDANSDALVEDWRINSQNHGVTSLITGDADNDGNVEVVWASGTSSSGADSLIVAGLAPSINIEWSNLTSSNWLTDGIPQLDGPFVGGNSATVGVGDSRSIFATDGTNNGYKGTRLISMDTQGNLSISSEVGSNWNGRVAINVADYDQDSVDEVFIATSNTYDGFFTVYDFLGDTAEWSSNTGTGVGVSVAAGDVNGDNSIDFAVINARGLTRVYDVLSQSLIDSINADGSSASDVKLADLDGDNIKEIITLQNNKLIVYEQTLLGYSIRYSVALRAGLVADICDLDGDNKLEIVVLSGEKTQTYSGYSIHVFDNQANSVNAFDFDGTATDLFIDKTAGFPRNIIVATRGNGNNSYIHNSNLNWISPNNGSTIYRSQTLMGYVSPNSINYLDSLKDKLVIGTSKAMYITK